MTHPVDELKTLGRLQQAYINGQWVTLSSTRSHNIINPSDESLIGELTLGIADDADTAIQAAAAAFSAWSQTSVDERLAILDGVIALFEARAEQLAHILSTEMGAPINYARTAHVPLALAHLQVARDNLASYEFTKMRGTTAIAREPIGVAGLITPWNWPLYQITAKVGPAIASGCTVVLKPSELSPLSALAFADILHDAGVPAGVFNLLNGDGPEVGSVLSSHPLVDMVSITGSTRAGILVAQAAAPTVKRVAQELGGKSPNIILPDADLQAAIGPGVLACMRNNGQSCSAPTRMLVPREQLAEAEQLAIEAVNTIVIGRSDNETATHGPLANRAQFERVQLMIEKGLSEDAKCITGGVGRPDGFEAGFFVRPTIFSDVTNDMAIAREEIFGPVLCMIPYDTVDEAIAMANDTVYGLAAHVQSKNLNEARRVARLLRSGQVHINYPAWDAHAPFGGYKQSGSGREFGLEGFEEYLETKAIVGFDEA